MGLGGFPDGYGDDIDISESEEDELDDLADPRVAEVDSEEEAPKLVKAKKSKNKRAAEDSDDEEKADIGDTIKKILKPSEETKLSKRQAKKLKNNAGEAVEGASTEKAEVKKAEVKKDEKKSKKDEKKAKKEEQSPSNGKKVQFAEKLEQGPTGTKTGKTVPRVVSGVTVEDKKAGSGPGAKKGDKVGMRYIGKLTKKDGKVFDCKFSDPIHPFRLPLSFAL
jgi:FK506-binding nuclear protein